MRLLALALALLIATTGSPAFSQPREDPARSPERIAWPDLGSPLDSPLGRLLAQDEETNEDRIREIDQEIAGLARERSRTRLTGPIVVTSVGIGMAAVGGATAGLVALRCEQAKRNQYETCNEGAAETLEIAFGIIAGAGAIMAVAGGISWASRASEGRRIDEKQRQLREQRRRLSNSLASLRLGTHVRDGNRFLTLDFDF